MSRALCLDTRRAVREVAPSRRVIYRSALRASLSEHRQTTSTNVYNRCNRYRLQQTLKDSHIDKKFLNMDRVEALIQIDYLYPLPFTHSHRHEYLDGLVLLVFSSAFTNIILFRPFVVTSLESKPPSRRFTAYDYCSHYLWSLTQNCYNSPIPQW